MTPWYRELFGEDYLRMYLPRLTEEATDAQVEGLIRLLGLEPGTAVLDLCCGHGRHAVRLAQRGFRVTGQDLSEVFLDRARSDAADRGVEVRWVHGDMREIPFDREFDAVINFFTAFGYLENEDEDLKVLCQVRKALKPGGRFLLETMHRDALLRRFQPSGVTRHEDGLLVIEERKFDLVTSRIEGRMTLIDPDGRRSERSHSLRLYTVRELVRMSSAAGLRFETVYGGIDGSALALDSPRVVLLAAAG